MCSACECAVRVHMQVCVECTNSFCEKVWRPPPPPLSLFPDLVEKKRERAAAQAADDLKRKHEMELEEVLGDATRKRGVPQEVD